MIPQSEQKRPDYTLEFKQDEAKLLNEKAIHTNKRQIV